MAAGDNHELLEIMCPDDHSWHPCHLSLSSSILGSSGLFVFSEDDDDFRDFISSKEEALARLRIRSIPLQDGDCINIKEGEHILAMCEQQSESLFYDAEVEKIWRVKHSSDIQCQCSFGIRWLHPEMNGKKTTISLSSVRKLAENSVLSHHIVTIFLNSVNSSTNSGLTASVTLPEDLNYETDIHRLLEEQIQAIGEVADPSSEAFSEETFWGVRKENSGHTKCKSLAASGVSCTSDETLCNQINTRRTTRSQKKLQLEVESKDSSTFQPSPVEHLQKQVSLNPLAARAALASLMHEVPQNPEITIYHVEKEGHIDTSQSTPEKHMNVVSLDVTRMFINSETCIQEKLLVSSNHSSVVASMPVASDPVKVADDTFGKPMLASRSFRNGYLFKNDPNAANLQNTLPAEPQRESLSTPSFTSRFTRAVMNRLSPNLTAKASRSPVQKQNRSGNNEANLKLATEDENLNSAPVTKRATSSTAQKETKHLTNELKMVSSNKYEKLISPTTMQRVTRASISTHKGKNTSVNETKLESMWDAVLGGPNIVGSPNFSTQNVQANSFCEDVPKSSAPATESKSPKSNSSKILTCSASQEEGGMSVKKSSTEDEFPTITRRSTRSASREVIEHSPDSAKLILSDKDERKGSFAETTRLTRSGYQRATGNAEIKMDHTIKDGELSSPTITRRKTRSSAEEVMENSPNDAKLNLSGEIERKDSLAITSRLTRSATQRATGIAVDEIKVGSTTQDRKLCSPSTPDTTKRLTHTSFESGMLSPANGIKQESAGRDNKLNGSSITRRLTRSAVQKGMVSLESEFKIDSSNNGRQMGSNSITRSTCIQKGEGFSTVVDPYISLEDQKSSITHISQRLTRSAIQKNMDNSTAQDEKVCRRRRSSEDLRIDDSVDLVIPSNKGPKRKRSFLSSDIETNSSHVERQDAKSPVAKFSRVRRELENGTSKVRGKQSHDLGSSLDLSPIIKEDPKKRSIALRVDVERNISQGKRKMVETPLIVKEQK